MKRWIFTALCCLLIYPSSAFAQTTITVDAKDKPLQIKGWLNEENTLVGSIRLSAPAAVEKLTFLASDLKRQEGEGGIGRQQIAFIGEPKLQAGIPKDFQVKVTNPQLPGTYKGQIEVLLANQKPQVIPFTVLVKVRPTLIPLRGNEQVQLQLTQCNPLLDCGLARLLFPASAFLQSWDLAFDNSVDAPVKVTGAEVLLKGEQTGYQLTSNQIKVSNIPQTLAADSVVRLPLTWDSLKIPPDRYTGAVYLSLDGARDRLIIPVNLTGRIAPLMPLLVLVLGIVLGRLIKYMQKKGIPQAEALGKVKELEQQVDKTNPEDRNILKPMVGDARKLVQEMKLESATAEVEKINARLECLQQLRTIEQKLEPIKSHPQVKGDNGILKKISNVRMQIDLQQDEQAKALLEEVQKDVANLPSPTMMGQTPNYNLSEIVTSLKTAVVAVGNAVQSGVSKPVNQWLFWSQQVLAFISGKEFRAQATYWFARPLFSLALLIGLSTVGMRSLYVQKGGTFGADPFSDYLGLILWGLSADVASRSLSDLAGGEEKKE
ncbi:MAG TPA: hypothetical protein DDW76_10295 [Cyanobacteria bacterium UBA11369]|nr:hypothetical protein [Cyanobacteria bacterium UBA11371]HBE17337.1 hypothetical protein [Cyanobacteria bacterium UBA11367]HBE30538.1 hypothetical protein [Cyanobacteria bacterium UBA11368]HBE49163.1 hypothetical protein [Cyanobacteria bacterium UBA11369]